MLMALIVAVSVFDLQGKVDVRDALMDRACRNDINICEPISMSGATNRLVSIPLLMYSATLPSVNPPLHSNNTRFFPCHRPFKLAAAAFSPSPSKLSSITMSAPASIASSASASDWHSTSILSAKPPTARAACTALVIEPGGPHKHHTI